MLEVGPQAPIFLQSVDLGPDHSKRFLFNFSKAAYINTRVIEAACHHITVPSGVMASYWVPAMRSVNPCCKTREGQIIIEVCKTILSAVSNTLTVL